MDSVDSHQPLHRLSSGLGPVTVIEPPSSQRRWDHDQALYQAYANVLASAWLRYTRAAKSTEKDTNEADQDAASGRSHNAAGTVQSWTQLHWIYQQLQKEALAFLQQRPSIQETDSLIDLLPAFGFYRLKTFHAWHKRLKECPSKRNSRGSHQGPQTYFKINLQNRYQELCSVLEYAVDESLS